MIKISVIIPVYNAEKTIGRLFKQLSGIQRDDIEFILINDGSVDKSEQLCKKFVSICKNAHYYNQSNKGVSSARNYGLDVSTGQYVMFIDADDDIEPDYFSPFLGLNNYVDFAITGYSITQNSKIIQKYSCKDFEGSIHDFLQQIDAYTTPPYLYSPWAKAFKKDIIDEFDIRFRENLSYGEDVIFVLEYLKKARHIKSLCGCGYLYSIDNNNSLGRFFKKERFDSDMAGTQCLYELLLDNKIPFAATFCDQKIMLNFVLYTQYMIKSKIKLNDAKKLFYENVEKYNLKSYKWNNGRKSFKIIGLAIRSTALFPLVLLFKK